MKRWIVSELVSSFLTYNISLNLGVTFSLYLSLSLFISLSLSLSLSLSVSLFLSLSLSLTLSLSLFLSLSLSLSLSLFISLSIFYERELLMLQLRCILISLTITSFIYRTTVPSFTFIYVITDRQSLMRCRLSNP